MIKIQESVPSIYYNSSRDFQLIGHLFDLVLNATKTDADMIFNLPFSTNSDDQLLDLMAFTFGLRLDKTKYTTRQLRNVCSVAPQMMRNKGSLKAVQILCTALMRADDIEGTFLTEVSENGSQLTIYISSIASCKDIISEILPYILPAGMIFNIKQTQSAKVATQENIIMKDQVKYNVVKPSAQIVSKSQLLHVRNNTVADEAIFKSNASNDTTADLTLKNGLIPSLVVADLRSMSETELLAPTSQELEEIND